MQICQMCAKTHWLRRLLPNHFCILFVFSLYLFIKKLWSIISNLKKIFFLLFFHLFIKICRILKKMFYFNNTKRLVVLMILKRASSMKNNTCNNRNKVLKYCPFILFSIFVLLSLLLLDYAFYSYRMQSISVPQFIYNAFQWC